jgi:hypothetical protein
MAISVENTYPGRSNVGDANYPEGSIVNETIPDSSNDGTPLDELWGNDYEGLKQAILRSGSIVPTVPGNVPDTAIASQQLQGLIELSQGRATNYDDSGVADAYVLDAQTNQQEPGSLFDGQEFTFIVGNTNAGASTVNPVGKGVKNIVDTSAGGELVAGEHVTVRYRLGSDDCMLVDHFDNATTVMASNTMQNAIDEGVGTGQKRVSAAWVNFDGTGTIAIRDEFNVTSLTDNGTGDYTINFTTVLGNTTYALLPVANASEVTIQSQASSNCRILTRNSSGTSVDAVITCMGAFSTR